MVAVKKVRSKYSIFLLSFLFIFLFSSFVYAAEDYEISNWFVSGDMITIGTIQYSLTIDGSGSKVQLDQVNGEDGAIIDKGAIKTLGAYDIYYEQNKLEKDPLNSLKYFYTAKIVITKNSADVTINWSYKEAPTVVGESFEISLFVENNKSVAAENLVFTHIIPNEFTIEEVTGTGCVKEGQSVVLRTLLFSHQEQECIYTLLPEKEIFGSLESELSYSDAVETYTVSIPTLSFNITNPISLSQSASQTTFYVGNSTNVSYILVNNASKRINDVSLYAFVPNEYSVGKKKGLQSTLYTTLASIPQGISESSYQAYMYEFNLDSEDTETAYIKLNPTKQVALPVYTSLFYTYNGESYTNFYTLSLNATHSDDSNIVEEYQDYDIDFTDVFENVSIGYSYTNGTISDEYSLYGGYTYLFDLSFKNRYNRAFDDTVVRFFVDDVLYEEKTIDIEAYNLKRLLDIEYTVPYVFDSKDINLTLEIAYTYNGVPYLYRTQKEYTLNVLPDIKLRKEVSQTDVTSGDIVDVSLYAVLPTKGILPNVTFNEDFSEIGNITIVGSASRTLTLYEAEEEKLVYTYRFTVPDVLEEKIVTIPSIALYNFFNETVSNLSTQENDSSFNDSFGQRNLTEKVTLTIQPKSVDLIVNPVFSKTENILVGTIVPVAVDISNNGDAALYNVTLYMNKSAYIHYASLDPIFIPYIGSGQVVIKKVNVRPIFLGGFTENMFYATHQVAGQESNYISSEPVTLITAENLKRGPILEYNTTITYENDQILYKVDVFNRGSETAQIRMNNYPESLSSYVSLLVENDTLIDPYQYYSREVAIPMSVANDSVEQLENASISYMYFGEAFYATVSNETVEIRTTTIDVENENTDGQNETVVQINQEFTETDSSSGNSFKIIWMGIFIVALVAVGIGILLKSQKGKKGEEKNEKPMQQKPRVDPIASSLAIQKKATAQLIQKEKEEKAKEHFVHRDVHKEKAKDVLHKPISFSLKKKENTSVLHKPSVIVPLEHKKLSEYMDYRMSESKKAIEKLKESAQRSKFSYK